MKALTGKAKQAFEQWVLYLHYEIRFRSLIKIHNQRDLFISYDDIPGDFLNTLIIEWLDSVGIFIEISGVQYQFDTPEFTYNIQEVGTLNGVTAHVFDNRQQATEKAIERAVELFNEK